MRRTSVKATTRAAALLAVVGLFAAGCGSSSSGAGTAAASKTPAGGQSSGKAAASGTLTVWADDTRTPIVQQIGVEKGLHMILIADPQTIYWADTSLDLSAEITRRMDATSTTK